MDPNNKQPFIPSNDAPPPPASNAASPLGLTAQPMPPQPDQPQQSVTILPVNESPYTPTVSSGTDYTPPFAASNPVKRDNQVRLGAATPLSNPNAPPLTPATTSVPDFSMHEPTPPASNAVLPSSNAALSFDSSVQSPEPVIASESKPNVVPQPYPPIVEQPASETTVIQPSIAPQQVQAPVAETPAQQIPTLLSAQPIPQPVPMPQPMQPVSPPVQPVSQPQPVQPFAKFPEQLPQQAPVPSPTPNPAFASVLTPPPASNAASPALMPIPAASVASAFTKKSKLPKIILFIALAVLGLSLLAFAAMKFLGGVKGTGSAVGKKGELTWWGMTLDEDVVAPLIADYQAQHSDVKITYVKQSPQDYRERLTNALASGKGPDIFEFHNSWPSMFKNDLSAIPVSVMNADEYKRSFYPIFASDLTTQKGIVGMPIEYDAITLYVNEDIFSTALKTPPKTWIDMQQLADPKTGLTQRDETGRILQSAVALGTTDNVEYWPEVFGLMMFQNKAQFNDLSTQTAKDVVTFYKYFGQPTGNWDSTLPKSTEGFAKQKVAMILAPGRAAYDIVQQNPSLRFKTYPLPQLPKEVPTEPDVSYATYWAEGVWERSASKDLAWDFLKFAGSEQSLQKVNANLKAKSKIERVYPRPNMNPSLVNHPILGSIITLAPVAKSWYLADKTNDGQTGINTQLKNAYAKIFGDGDPKTALAEITKILTQYGVSVPK